MRAMSTMSSRLCRAVGLGLLGLAGLVSLIGSGGGGDGGGGGNGNGNPTPLTVASTSPANGATSVAVNTNVSATFNLALTASPTFAVSGPGGAVAGSVVSAGSTATFTPTAPLANSTTYTASVSGGTGTGGGTLASAVSWSFTTAAAGGGGSGVTISGLADYASVPPDTASGRLNYNGTTFKPIRGATVEILASPGGAVLASGVTSASGTYSLNIANAQTFVVRIKAEMKRTGATGGQWDFTVRDNTQGDALYVMDSSPVSPSGSTVTQNLRANSGWGGAGYTSARVAAPFAILDVIYNATQKVLSASPNLTFPALKAFWSINNRPVGGNLALGEIGTSFFRFTGTEHQTYILGAEDTDTDEYDTHVVAHEWGHYFQAAFSRNDSTGGPHSGNDRLDMRLAFGEGWGNAWSGMAMGTGVYTDSSGNDQQGGFRIDLAQAPTTNIGWFNESSVQYLLWTWHNTAGIGFGPIFNVMSGPLRTEPSLVAIHAFAHHLKAALPAQATTINALMSAQQIVAQDALGTGETNNGGIALALPVYKTHTAGLGVAQNYCITDSAGATGSEYNKLGAYVFIRFTVTAGSRTITVTSTSAPTAADPDFEVQRADGTSNLFNQGVTTSETGTLTLPAGTHNLIVTDYNLTHSAATGNSCFNVVIQ